ncbi:uncharacterized protein LOC123504873 [Portunus trituberculatus]|uniref:uncharacterized protein LOC123504873 n=1 Tax=Portunus trituberculatus TaxID=210409 RepID=UPI001E1D0462|nr:uncharacterized protein LOC123504873 [Portunus trituberculatus]
MFSPEKTDENVDDASILEQELDRLRNIVSKQDQLLQQIGAHLPTPQSQRSANSKRESRFRDSSSHSNHQILHNCNTWKKLKSLLNDQFNKEANFDRAWQDINSECYDWSESPQAFVNNFICNYAILGTRFATEKLPDRDKIIKRKLWQGLTQEAKAGLEGFLDENYPLNKFIERVEHERQWLKATHVPSLGRIKPERKEHPPKLDHQTEAQNASPPDLIKSNATSSESSDVSELKKQIRDLAEQVGKLHTSPRQPQNERYCSHCRSHSHSLKECWRKPARGSCFDCRQFSCWRGNSNCPGKPKNI